jgi:Ni/Fe-hydrogenase subunit HybB-like protein
MNRALGPYWWAWLLMVIPNVVVPQVFWFKKVRQNLVIVFIISIVVNVGMWFERFVIIVIGLHRDFLPSSWGYYTPSWVDICTFIGTFGLFFTCFLLFIRFLPMIAVSEVKGVIPQADPHHPLGGAKVQQPIHNEE